MSEKNNTASLGWGTRISYGLGDTACNIVFGMITALLTLFYTDYCGIPVVTVGLVMLISRIFDGSSDVIMGIIVSKTKSKWGKARPWILWMSVPYVLCAVAMFCVPHSSSTTVQFWYIFVTYNLCTTVCYTAINVPYGTLSTMMTRSSHERDLLSVVRMSLSPIGKIIAVTFTMPVIKLFGNDHLVRHRTCSACHLLCPLQGNRQFRGRAAGAAQGSRFPCAESPAGQPVFLGNARSVDRHLRTYHHHRHRSAVLLQICSRQR